MPGISTQKVHHNAGDRDGRSKATRRRCSMPNATATRREPQNCSWHCTTRWGCCTSNRDTTPEAEEAFSKAVAAGQETGSGELEGYSRYISSAQYANGRYAEAIETLSPAESGRDTMVFCFFAQQITLQNLDIPHLRRRLEPPQLLEERARIDMHELRTAPLTHGPASADDEDRTLYDTFRPSFFYRAGAARFGAILHRPLAGAHQTFQPEQHRALHDRLCHTPPSRGGR